VLPKIINTDQKGFVKGRNIFDGNRLLQDIIDYTEIEDEEGAIIFLDQQKAFDRAEWEWIDFCLENVVQRGKKLHSHKWFYITLRKYNWIKPSRVSNCTYVIHIAGGALGGIHSAESVYKRD
jgi:hypothetical protein